MKGSDRPALKPAIYFGAGVSAFVPFVPYVHPLFAFVLGPLAGVWFETRWRSRQLSFTQGAEIGFFSAFYGVLAASAIYDIAWHFFHEQLWRLNNAYRLLPLLAGKGQESSSPLEWYVFMLQLTLIAIIAGALAAPAGLLGVKLFQRDGRN